MHKVPPLPLDFYDSKAWHEAILDFYSTNTKFPPRHILERPVASLTKSVGNIIDIYGNFPSTHLNLFKQTVNPLYEDKEYERMVYNVIKSVAVEESEPKFNKLADSLLIIRWIFAKNRDFLIKNFSEEISKINLINNDDKLMLFVDSMRVITKTHINQIISLIEKETKIFLKKN